MALSGKVTINPEHLQGGNGTLHRALELWSCRNGPVQYNTWQSVFFGLIRDHGYKDEGAVDGETSSQRQKRIRTEYNEIHLSIHGPDYLAAALLSQKSERETVEQGTRPEDNEGWTTGALVETGRGLETPPGLTPEKLGESPDWFLQDPEAEKAWDENSATHTE